MNMAEQSQRKKKSQNAERSEEQPVLSNYNLEFGKFRCVLPCCNPPTGTTRYTHQSFDAKKKVRERSVEIDGFSVVLCTS